MICLRENNQGAELLIGHLEGSLSAADRQVVDAHAAECAECAGLLGVQGKLDVPVPEVSPNFDAKLYARIAADADRRPWWRLSWRVLAPVAGLAAMLAVAVTIQRPAPVSVDPDVQQLEQALKDMELLMPEAL